MREAQSVPVSGPLGSAWAYPRSRTGDGRRIIYFPQDDHIFVCELYPATAHDDAYNRARVEGVDAAGYSDFQPWSADVAEPG